MNYLHHYLSNRVFTHDAFASVFNTQALTALQNKDIHSLLELQNHGFDFQTIASSIKGKFGKMFLSICLQAYSSEPHAKLALSLVKCGVDLTQVTDLSHLTVFHIALGSGLTELFCACVTALNSPRELEALLAKRDRNNRLALSLMQSYQAFSEAGDWLAIDFLPLAIQYGCTEACLMP